VKITDISAIQILDSRGNPTIKVTVQVGDIEGCFSVPSGASTGTHEALELRDGGKPYGGLGVTKAVANVAGSIREALVGQDPTDQSAIDEILTALDGTKNKSRLGSNAILGTSGAVTRAAAAALGLPLYQYLKILFENDGRGNTTQKHAHSKYILPRMYFNILNGGAHAANNVDIQETMVVPQRDTVAENLRIASEVYHALKEVLISRDLATGLGDEGGFAPNLESNMMALDLVTESIQKAGYKPGYDVCIALDIAASELIQGDKYVLAGEGIALSAQQLGSWYKELIATFPIISIEDGLAEDDWIGWAHLTARIGDIVQLVGDDLFVTNISRIRQGIDNKAANAVLIKVNQIGTITETLDAIRLALKSGYKCMISHRSGETDDTFIADLAVATGVGQIKSGAPARGERIAKYDRLVEIEKELSGNL
jgi:enolase